jgi:hypothetical protein
VGVRARYEFEVAPLPDGLSIKTISSEPFVSPSLSLTQTEDGWPERSEESPDSEEPSDDPNT